MEKLKILLFIGLLTSCNSKESELKTYLFEFEKVNELIINNYSNERSNLLSIKDLTKFNVINNAIENSKLCEIKNYPKKAIIYKFQCKMNSSDKFVHSDDKYYLIKILNGYNEILSYEQFTDYSKKPINMNNNWYFIRQNITYD